MALVLSLACSRCMYLNFKKKRCMCLRWLTLILQHRWLLLESSSALSPLVCFWVPLGRDLQMRCTPFTDVIHSYEHICHHDIHSGFCTRTCFARCFSSIDKARSIGLCIRETFMTEHLPNTFRLFLKKKSLIRKNLMLFTSLLSKIFFSGS